jgi:Leucine-rich repeat (LRR) protein
LECLRHLRELKADGNMITDLTSIMTMDNLIKLSCNDNRLTRIDFNNAKWYVDLAVISLETKLMKLLQATS